MTYKQSKNLQELIDKSKKILIVQANNPDGDSLASSLALEQIFHDMGKEPILYCGMNIPSYLRYLPGWDRVENEVPQSFDMTIIVDCSSISLLESAEKSGQLSWIAAKPTVVIDHHDVTSTIDFSNITINDSKAVATGEVIYEIANDNNWALRIEALNMLAISILSDSLGLMSQGTTPRSIRIIASLVENGVDLPELDNARRELMRKSVEVTRYKADLIKRIKYSDNNLIATVIIPWEEIEKYSNEYNPSMLVIDDMRLTEGTAVAIAFKQYQDGKVTAKIRSNYGFPIAGKLAEKFGGGGHEYASGFKIKESKPIDEIERQTIEAATALIKEAANEAI